MLHRLAELDELVRKAYADFDYKRIFAALASFMTADLSAFYFDIRKDALYCDPYLVDDAQGLPHRARSSVPLHGDVARADAVLHGGGILGRRATAPTRSRCISNCSPRCRRPGATTSSPRSGARCAPCAASSPARLEIERAQKRIGSSLEAHPIVHVSDEDLFEAVVDIDLAEVCITSAATLVEGRGPGRRLPSARCAGRRGRPQSRRRHQVRALVENPHHHRRRSRLSGRLAARRQGAARMGNHAQGGGVNAVVI